MAEYCNRSPTIIVYKLQLIFKESNIFSSAHKHLKMMPFTFYVKLHQIKDLKTMKDRLLLNYV